MLEILGEDEHQAISIDGVSFLIAAPLENDCVVPTNEYLPIHVFYPTEQKGPVRLLLHAEFLVKSDRTALMPLDGNPFNEWVAEKLAYNVCKFVNDSYCPETPSCHAGLLVPFGERGSHPVAEDLWQRIKYKAQADLRLPNIQAQQRLTLADARLISVSVRVDLARTLLEATTVRERLLHPAFDDDKEARKTLRELGCKEVNDQNLLGAIAEYADSLADNSQWVWACWEWLAAWVAKEPYGEEHKKRIERAKTLPIVPIGGSLLKASELAGRIVTWVPGNGIGILPVWLPLAFVENWFRDRIESVAQQEPPAKKLCAELGITAPGADVIQRAMGRAIEQYWKDKQGDPERFLRFILEQNWHETAVAPLPLKRCPVPLSQPQKGEAWFEAGKAYFGREWNNDLLAVLYESHDSVAWVHPFHWDSDKERSILAWLGCATFPRIIKDRGSNGNGIRAHELPDQCHAWRTQEFGYTDRTPTVDAFGNFEDLAVEDLSDTQVRAMLVLLGKHWEEYYKGRAQAKLSWFYYTMRSRTILAFWWFEILNKVRPTIKNGSKVSVLTNCWLPDKRTERTIGELLPVIDLDAFEEDKDVVRDWLINAVGLRRRIEELTVEEWKTLLSTRIPARIPIERLVSDERLRDKITGWYVACLETMAEQENHCWEAFASCPLLCEKGASWGYAADELRYLNDDNDLAKAFIEDVWLFHVPVRLANDAVKYFGVLPLSESVQVHVTPGELNSPLSDELLGRLNESLPYVWVWRSSQRKQDAEKLSTRLKGLEVRVVPALMANLSLNGLHHEVERRWHVTEDTIFLHENHSNESELAQALAKVLDVRSEADFYENLLRCNDGLQRKEKLLSKGIADAEVERCLREYSYSGSPNDVEELAAEVPPPREKEPISPPSPVPPIEKKQPNPLPGEEQGTPPEEPREVPAKKEQLFRFKDAQTVNYVIGTPPVPGLESGGGGGSGEKETHPLTEEERAELEKAGRCIAARELNKLGYALEEMPMENPGFDLRAIRKDEELRVEVKAHTGRTTVVEVTQRQYKEYLGQQGYCWELWNIEHLAESDADPVAITRYADIPEEALSVRTFRVDLKKCLQRYD